MLIKDINRSDIAMKGIFITGTGTDVGKTFVTGLLVKKLRYEGNVDCGYFKAALSGAEVVEDNIGKRLIAGDADYVYKTAGIEGNPNSAVSYIFEQAVSPHLASKINDVEITMDKIKNDFDNMKNKHDYLVMEGSGGIICPIYEGKKKIMLEDIIKELGLSVILVADGGLGTINSTLLTVEYLKRRNINIKALVLNNYDENNIIHSDNKRYLSEALDFGIYTCKTDGENVDISPETLKGLFDEF